MNSARRRGAIAQMKINHARETRVARRASMCGACVPIAEREARRRSAESAW
jgi:hypothetical protein